MVVARRRVGWVALVALVLAPVTISAPGWAMPEDGPQCHGPEGDGDCIPLQDWYVCIQDNPPGKPRNPSDKAFECMFEDDPSNPLHDPIDDDCGPIYADGEVQYVECLLDGPLPDGPPPDPVETLQDGKGKVPPTPGPGSDQVPEDEAASEENDGSGQSADEALDDAAEETPEPDLPERMGVPVLPRAPDIPETPWLDLAARLETEPGQADQSGTEAPDRMRLPDSDAPPSAAALASSHVALWRLPKAEIVAGAGLAALLAGLFYALWPTMKGGSLAVPSYARIRKDRLLDHASRDALVRLVEERPGIALPDLYAQPGFARSSVRHHLDRLRRHGLVRTEKIAGVWRVFPSHVDLPSAARALVLRGDPKLAGFLSLLTPEQPIAVRQALLRVRARWSLSESGGRKVIRRAVRHGFVALSGAGAQATLRVQGSVPPPA